MVSKTRYLGTLFSRYTDTRYLKLRVLDTRYRSPRYPKKLAIPDTDTNPWDEVIYFGCLHCSWDDLTTNRRTIKKIWNIFNTFIAKKPSKTDDMTSFVNYPNQNNSRKFNFFSASNFFFIQIKCSVNFDRIFLYPRTLKLSKVNFLCRIFVLIIHTALRLH